MVFDKRLAHKNEEVMKGGLRKMYENLVQEIKTAENNILFFTGKSKSANKLVDDMRKKIDTLKEQLTDLENKINQIDAE